MLRSSQRSASQIQRVQDSDLIYERFSGAPYDLLQTTSDLPPGHQDAATTTEALQSDVGA